PVASRRRYAFALNPIERVRAVAAQRSFWEGAPPTSRGRGARGPETGLSRMLLGLILVCGLLSIVYAVYTVNSLMASDAGTARMQEIAAAVAEGAQAYLRRQYMTI